VTILNSFNKLNVSVVIVICKKYGMNVTQTSTNGFDLNQLKVDIFSQSLSEMLQHFRPDSINAKD
jgi:hypothetical protein